MRALAVFLALTWLCAVPARAATFEAMDFDRLAAEAEQVFIGTVDSTTTLAPSPRRIVTDFRFVDIEVIKGDPPGPSTSVRMLGGTVGDLTLAIPGAPTFRVGTRYLVFIAGNRRVMFPTLGGSQGIFQIRQNAVTGEAEVYDYGGQPVTVPPGIEPLAAHEKSVVVRPMTQEAFVGEILMRLGSRR